MKKNIAIIMGGYSSEYDISIKSGDVVYKTLSEDKDLNPRELMKKITQLEIIIDLYKEI